MNPKYTRSDATHIHFDFWLVFGSDGGVKLTREQPSTDRNQHRMKMTASLPKSLWRTPQLSGKIVIADSIMPPVQIDLSAASDALRTALGVDIDLRIIETETHSGTDE